MSATNEIWLPIAGHLERLDLDDETQLLPSFQVSDMLTPEKIQSDYTPELSAPGTQNNHRRLGQAAYDDNTARVPYRSIANALLLSEGLEIMPRARLLVKGYEDGRYGLQLFSGLLRFVERLGERTLRDLDFSRFDHTYTLDNIADRATPAYLAANGWGYQLFDRGKPLVLTDISPRDLSPVLSADLIWQQLLTETGFTASSWQSPLLDKLLVPSVTAATLSEATRTARRLRVGLGPGHADGSGATSANRNTVDKVIPYDDYTRPIGTVPPIVPTVPGMYDPVLFSWKADQACYVTVEARTVVELIVSYAKAGAQVFLYRNGVAVAGSDKTVVDTDSRFSVGVQVAGLLVQANDVLTARLTLTGEEPNILGTKWGYRIFRDAVFNSGTSLPVDRFSVTVEEALAPGGVVRLSDFLPEVKLLDFFKTLVQLGGLTQACDEYENHLLLTPSAAALARPGQAHDWTAKRDAPAGPAGLPRKVEYRYGSFSQQNWFRYAADETVPTGYGDGSLAINDETLPPTADLVTLPFAASPPSSATPGLVFIPAYKLRENEDPFADPAYDAVKAMPRLLLTGPRTLDVTLTDSGATRAVTLPVAHFADNNEAITLDAQAYVLPVNWAGLRAQLTDCRFHTERYRISPAELRAFLADRTRPVWDAGLGGYFSISSISEYSATRSVEVQMLRLHPSFLPAPTVPGDGQEFYGPEFYTTAEFY